MLCRGDRVLVALSGGADSMCLLHCLLENSESSGITVCAAHYNHKLRGEESERDARFAGEQCESLNVPFICGSGDVASIAMERHQSTEECARELRYAFLNEAAAKLGCNKIATAHNADDNAETVLLNLCRGSGLRGLTGIPQVRGNIIRPLLGETRSEIEGYLKEHGIPHVEDSSNQGDGYTRNILRHKVMPVMRELNPAFSEAVMRTADSLREDEEFLDSLAESFIAENSRGNALPAEKLRELSKPVAMRVIRKMCGAALPRTQCEAVYKLINSTELAFADVTGMRVAQDSGLIIFGAEEKRLGDYELPENGELIIPEAGLRVKASVIENCEAVNKSVNKFDFNCGSVCGKISLTSRRDGDKIALSYRGCTKSLKELFSEKKLPQEVRNMTPVLRDEKGVIAVYGFGIAKRCEAQIGDKILRIEIISDNTGENYGRNR